MLSISKFLVSLHVPMNKVESTSVHTYSPGSHWLNFPFVLANQNQEACRPMRVHGERCVSGLINMDSEVPVRSRF